MEAYVHGESTARWTTWSPRWAPIRGISKSQVLRICAELDTAISVAVGRWHSRRPANSPFHNRLRGSCRYSRMRWTWPRRPGVGRIRSVERASYGLAIAASPWGKEYSRGVSQGRQLDRIDWSFGVGRRVRRSFGSGDRGA